MTTKELPPDPGGINDECARLAGRALECFVGESGLDMESGLSDLLTNLMHWADRSTLVFADEYGRAVRNYEAETNDGGRA